MSHRLKSVLLRMTGAAICLSHAAFVSLSVSWGFMPSNHLWMILPTLTAAVAIWRR